MTRNQLKREIFKKEINKILLLSIKASQGQNFILRQLFTLWPSSRGILYHFIYNIGPEIGLFNQSKPILYTDNGSIKKSFLVYSILRGLEYHRKKLLRNLATRDRDVFIYFFKNLILTGSMIYNCYVKNLVNKSSWDYSVSPYMYWRIRNPGNILVYWDQKIIDEYLLYSFIKTIIPKHFLFKCSWIIKELEDEVISCVKYSKVTENIIK